MPPTPTPKQTSTGDTEYRYMGNHATEVPVGDTVVWLAPGEFVTLSSSEASMEKANSLINEGGLVEVSKIGEAGKEAEAEAESDETATTTEMKGGK